MYYMLYALFVLLLFIKSHVNASGAVALNEYTFDKVISKFPVVLVKFDVAFPYGEKYEVFKQLSLDAYTVPDLLVVEVGVKDYGDRENEMLAKSYKAVKDDFPVLKLFIQGREEPITYPKDAEYTLNAIKQFVRDNSHVYIGLLGCLESFDKIAWKFIEKKEKDDKITVLKEAEQLFESIDDRDKKSAKIYIMLMKKVLELGDQFITKEWTRVEKLLTGKLTPAKVAELQERLNIIQSFNPTKNDKKKEEL